MEVVIPSSSVLHMVLDQLPVEAGLFLVQLLGFINDD